MLAKMPDAELPQWLDKVDPHTVAVLRLDDGECLTAEILDFNDEPLARFVLMATLFLGGIIGSLPLFFLLMKRPYGFQTASAIVYTIFAVFFTFARTGSRGGKDLPPYMFTCPAVRPQFSRLLRRHLGFLVALFALQTLALAIRSSLPDWWNDSGHSLRGMPPFDIALLFLCLGLGFAQVFTNRSLLDRAHREFSS